MSQAFQPAQPARAHGLRLAALSLAMLLPSLGTSIANVALPSLAASFQAPIQNVQWVVISYLLAVTTLIVGAGRLGDMLGRRRVLLSGIAVFALGSALAVLSPNLWVMVGLRAMQGLGAAVMMSLTVASVSDMVPKDRTGSAMGLLGTVSAVGTALGPSMGGVLINAFGWPSVFTFLALAGTVAFLFGFQVFPADRAREGKPSPFDLPGMVVLALSLGAYALSTTLGGASPGLSNLALAALGVLGLGAFLAIERRAAAPLVRLALLRDRALAVSLVAMGLVSTIMMATLVVGPFYLSGVLRLSPVETGLVMSVGPAVSALAGVPAGRLVDRFGEATVACGGLTFVALGSGLMILLPGAFGVAGYVGGLAIITSGYALFQAANTTSVMRGAAAEQRGVTSALLGLSRNLGLITGASAMGAIFALGPTGEAGLQMTFAVALVLATAALCLVRLRRGQG